jgi:cell wall-associated NlpC family hydrolase
MLRIRFHLMLLFVAFAFVLALLKPLPGRAADADPITTTPDPVPPVNTEAVVPPLPVVKLKKPKPVRRTQLHAPLGDKIAKYARRFIGVRYTWGGSSPRSGFDCSGFVRYVYAHFGVSLAHSSYTQFTEGVRVARRHLKPGDLVFFHGLGHVGMYIGKGKFIHAPHTGTRVQIESLNGWYSGTFDGARRIVGAHA